MVYFKVKNLRNGMYLDIKNQFTKNGITFKSLDHAISKREKAKLYTYFHRNPLLDNEIEIIKITEEKVVL